MKEFKVYGITGGAGCGKSELMKILEQEFGGRIIISDEVSRELSLRGNMCYEMIVARFGSQILGPDLELDRKKMADKVFSDPDDLRDLNSIIHPQVRRRVEEIVSEAGSSGKYAFAAIESAILLDCGYEDICDEFWYIHADEDIRRRRMKENRGYSDEKIDAVMRNQPSEEYFRSRCGFVIVNNSGLEDMRRQLEDKLSLK